MGKEKMGAIEALAKAHEDMAKALRMIQEAGITVTEEKENSQPDVPRKDISLEEVRRVLSEKSRAGHTGKVKDLLSLYGAERLSDIAPEHYEELIRKAEVFDE